MKLITVAPIVLTLALPSLFTVLAGRSNSRTDDSLNTLNNLEHFVDCFKGALNDNNPCLMAPGVMSKCTLDWAASTTDSSVHMCFGKGTWFDIRDGLEGQRECAELCHSRCIDEAIEKRARWAQCKVHDGEDPFCGVYYGDNFENPGFDEHLVSPIS